jgi:hypothetical protein
MTTTHDPDGTWPAPSGQVSISVYVMPQEDGAADITLVRVGWEGASQWVPSGSLTLSTLSDEIASMTAHSLVERILRLLRPHLQSMVAEAWPPF